MLAADGAIYALMSIKYHKRRCLGVVPFWAYS
jgi:hypothetical protein